MDFDPDAYLASPFQAEQAKPEFDPDAYLASPPTGQSQPEFDPDAYLADQLPSEVGTAARSIGEKVVPTGFGVEGAVAGARYGAMAGAAIGSAVPVIGTGIGAGAGAIIGGLGGGYLADYLATKGQDWVLDKFGLRKSLGLDPEQRALDAKTNPTTDWMAGVAPAVATMRLDKGIGMLGRAGAAALYGGSEAITEHEQGQDLNPYKIGSLAATGVIAPGIKAPSQILTGRPSIDIARGLLARTAGKSPIPQPETRSPTDPVKQNIGGANEAASEGADEDDLVVANDLETTARGTAQENTKKIVPGIGNLPNLTTGVPTGGSLAHEASPPSAPNRDYRKGAAPAAHGIPTAPSEPGVNTDPIHPDLATVMNEGIPPFLQRTETGLAHPGSMEGTPPAPLPTGQSEQVPVQTGIAEAAQNPSQEPRQVPAQPAPGGTAELGGNTAAGGIEQPIIKQAMQLAMRRPIIETPMPSIANSSRNMRGPVVVDPSVPPEYRRHLAVHETVEQTLMAQGMKYDQAHNIATQAEKQSVEAAGIDWKKYSDWFNDNAKHIEAQNVNPNNYANLDLHVNPEEAIGHHTDKIGPSGEEGTQPVTASVTEREQQVIDATRTAIKDMPEASKRFEELSPKDQALKGTHILQTMQNESGTTAAKVPTEARLPYVRPKVGEQTARSKADAQRKQQAMNAWNRAYKIHGPENGTLDPNDRGAILKRAKDAMNTAKEGNNNADPLATYRINEKPPAYKWLKAARAVVANPTKNNINEFLSAHNLEGETGQNIEGELATKKRPTVEEAELGAEAPNAARENFPPLPDLPAGKDNSVREAENKARAFVQDLSPSEYEDLSRQFDLHNELDEPADPEQLLSEFKQTLKSGERHAGVGSKTIPVVYAENIAKLAPTEPGAAANAGQSRKDLLAEYNAKLASGELKAPTGLDERLETVEKAAKENTDIRTLDKEALSGSWGDAKKNTQEFMKDEQGAAPVQPWMVKTAKTVKDIFSPDVDPGITAAEEEYGNNFKELGSRIPSMFKQMQERVKQDTAELRGMVQKAAGFKLKPTEKRSLVRAWENRTPSSLTPELQGYHSAIDAPLIKEGNQLISDLKNLKEKTGIGKDIELLSGGITPYIHHMQVDKQIFNEAENRTVMPDPGNRLSGNPSSSQARKYFALRPVDAQGNEMPGVKARLLARTDGGDWVTAVIGKPIQGLSPGWGAALNEPLTLNVKGGGTQKYVLDNARIRELNNGNLKDPDGTPVLFHENSTLSHVTSNHELRVLLEKNRLAAEIQGLLDERGLATISPKKAIENGWAKSNSKKDLQGATTELPELAQKFGKDQYIPNHIRWELDHQYQQGISSRSGILEGANRTAQALLKSMFFTQPFIHAGNVLENFLEARGLDNFRPSGYNLKTIIDAHKMIREGANNADYRRWTMAGGNPMLRNVEYRDFAIKNARDLGENIANNPATWDPIARKFGMSSKELRRTLYDATQKPMWYIADTLSAHRFLENERLYNMQPEQAAEKANEWLPTYHTPATIPALGQNEASRAVAKIINTPAFIAFGPYTYEKLATYGRANLKMLAAPSNIYKTGRLTRENTQALGQALMMYGVMPWMVYNGLDKVAQYTSGDPNASVTRRGIQQIPHMLEQVREHKKPLLSPLKELNPSIPADLAMQAMAEHNWQGRPITQEGSSFPQQAKQAAIWAASQVAPPVEELLQGIKTGHPVEHFLAGQVGGVIPSPAGTKYLSNQQRNDQRAVKRYDKTSPF